MNIKKILCMCLTVILFSQLLTVSIGSAEEVLVENQASVSSIVIDSQPEDCEIKIGEEATFEIEATGCNDYQWQYSQDDGENWFDLDWEGSTTSALTFEVTADLLTNLYRCMLVNDDEVVYSDIVIVSELVSDEVIISEPVSDEVVVSEPVSDEVIISEPASDEVVVSELASVEALTITKQPENVTCNVGATVSLSLTATGATAYQWQFSQDGGSTWAKLYWEGAKTNTMTFAATEARMANLYRCEVTNGTDTIYSNTVTVTLPVEFAITAQPENVVCNAGETVSLSLTATGATAYRWQFSQDGGSTWAKLYWEGAKTDTMTFAATEARMANLYRCEVTNGTDTLYSNTVTVTSPVEFAITVQPENVICNAGETVSLSLTATGATAYQWQFSQDGGSTWAKLYWEGAKTDTMTFVATTARMANLYRCEVTNGVTPIYSEVVVVSLPLTVTAQPENARCNVGDVVSLNVVASNVYAYQWQYSVDGNEWLDLDWEGANTDTLAFEATEQNIAYQYRCCLTDAIGEVVYTDIVILETVAIVQNGVTYVAYGDGLAVQSYSGNTAELEIPETVEGLTVLCIGESAFENNSTLKSIDLPDTIQVISKCAFKNCTSLANMN